MIHDKKDLLSGSLLKNMIIFAVPLMLSSVLQLLFNAADLVIVGKFDKVTGSIAQGAVVSTGSLINLIVNLFVGFSIGANVIVARYIGAKNDEDVKSAVRTSIIIAFLSGVIIAAIGIPLARPMLILMNADPEVLPMAEVYLKIYFLGAPFIMLYNFGSSVLRAVGNTVKPMVYLTIAGIVNVILNLFMVIVLKMSVAGVAIATTASQVVSSVFVLHHLLTTKENYRLDLSNLKISVDKIRLIIKIGLPAGIQGILFSISNVLIQSSINEFNLNIITGNGISLNIEGFAFVVMNAFHQAAITFTGQFCGAKRYKEIGKIVTRALGAVVVSGVIMGAVMLLFGKPLLGIYSNDPEVIKAGLVRLNIFGLTFFTAGLMDVMAGTMRGLGYSFVPMLTSIIGVCGLRIVWIYTVFKKYHSVQTLYYSYPITWTITFIVLFVIYLIIKRRIYRREGITLKARRA
ncbi:MAG: MATE family efflux transporter [Ruminococcaceae bacterium]|nr:MATE family efflux transporter [Oscillospiraceae bacterium]